MNSSDSESHEANDCKNQKGVDSSCVSNKHYCLSLKNINADKFRNVQQVIKEHKIFTVCEEAKCPNRGECWSSGTATFLILGSVCTRACRFCAIDTGNPRGKLDLNEPSNCAKAVKLMQLKHVVVTSVDRDDLEDAGAQHYADCVRMIKQESPDVTVEVLTPDFQGNKQSITKVLESGIDVFAHNLETVRRLTPKARDRRANYRQSLDVLAYAKQSHPNVATKSSLMLGLGETEQEILQSMDDLRSVNVDILTLGQYLQPTQYQLPVHRHILPDEFKFYRQQGLQKGFKEVMSGPLVRSSYRAEEVLKKLQGSNL